MKLKSNATTLHALRDDIVQFVKLRAELKHSAIHTTASSKLKDQFRHAERELLELADQLEKMELLIEHGF